MIAASAALGVIAFEGGVRGALLGRCLLSRRLLGCGLRLGRIQDLLRRGPFFAGAFLAALFFAVTIVGFSIMSG